MINVTKTYIQDEKIMSCKLIDFKIMGDGRGSLIALEEHHNAPFN